MRVARRPYETTGAQIHKQAAHKSKSGRFQVQVLVQTGGAHRHRQDMSGHTSAAKL